MFLQINNSGDDDAVGIQAKIDELNKENSRYQLQMATADGTEKVLHLEDVVLAYPANQLTVLGSLSIYASRWREFLFDEPREANSEGGVMPPIWGTVAMTLIMSVIVVPFGVLAALYLKEYAKTGFIVSAVRISINNLAGVPSIVFGLGFFCYIIGASVDGGPAIKMPPGNWWFTVGTLTIVATLAFVCSVQVFTNNNAKNLVAWRQMLPCCCGLSLP